jgi:peptidoglycan hydrolase-like protein with peptidoglycan-binding domain
MKRITDSFIKNIVRQSLNENRRLLNEDDKAPEKCPSGGFCVGNKSYTAAKSLQTNPPSVNYGIDLTKWGQSIVDLCANGGMGATISESTISSVVDKISTQYSYTDTDEDVVAAQIKSLSNFPSFCAANEEAKSKGYDKFFVEKSWNGVGSGDYRIYVLNPILGLLKNSVSISEKYQKTYDEELKKQTEKKDADLLLAAKKCGFNTVDEYKKSGWKCEGPKFTIGGGGQNSVSFNGYKCITDHPAKINTQVPLPSGVGYKLDVLNSTINKFIYGVAKVGVDGTDTGVQKDTLSGEILSFDCNDKKIQHSLSTNVWNYSAALSGSIFTSGVKDQTKIVLTTDPDIEDDGKSNQSIQFENIKGFRYNLLTEVELKYVKGKLQTGPDVVAIQTKLGISTVGGYGTGTKAAVEKFQKDNGLPVTGDVDETTYKAIMLLKDPVVPSATGYTRDLTLKSTGPDVVAIQTRLGISTKGGFGTGTEAAVKSFQKKYKLSETGVVDKTTFDKIMAMPPAGTAAKYSGKKHNYTEGQWILVSPKTDDTQLSGNNGYFKIIKIVNEYSVQIDATFVADGPGGSTQRVLFGEDAKQGTQEVIKSDGDTQDNSGTGRRSTSGDNSSGRRSGTGSGTVDPEKQRQRDIRNKEFCDTLRQIKQYLNNTKEADLTVNCKKTQKTINQIMMALSPETPVAPIAPIEEPNVTTPRGNVRIY